MPNYQHSIRNNNVERESDYTATAPATLMMWNENIDSTMRILVALME